MKQTLKLKKVGIVSDAHGIRGEAYIIIFSGDISWIDDIQEIAVKSASTSLEQWLKIKKIKPFKKGFIASFDGIIDRNQAEEIKKFEVWIDENLFVSEDGEQPFLTELLGFELHDKSLGLVGRVSEFSSNGQQDLLVLDTKVNLQSVEIPFIKEFVIEVDYKTKKIMTDLPKGLVQINEKD